MGRYDLRPLRVHRTITRAHLAQPTRYHRPPWFDVVGKTPPAQILVRIQPLQLQERGRRSKTKKPSKLFQPTVITFEEDRLRRTFFTDHPWELARPRMVLETDGMNEAKDDWSKMSQSRRPLSGESVVRRQVWLRNNKGMTSTQAYDQARKEFYELRLQEEVEQRVAHEEALANGAYFGKSALQVGMELEDKEFERWKEWAERQHLVDEQKRAAMYTNVGKAQVPDDDITPDDDIAPDDDELEDVSNDV